MEEYKKSLEDEIDWKIIDQLHTATSNFSTTSLTLKKLFFVLIGITVPILIKLSDNKLDTSLFVTIYLIALSFWLLDSFTYFFQEKLREKMNEHFGKIKERNIKILIMPNNISYNFTLENKRDSKSRFRRSLLNMSVAFYICIIILNTIAFILYLTRIIQ